MNTDALLFSGFVLGIVTVPLLWALAHVISVRVGESEAVVVTRFGKLARVLRDPGWVWMPARLLPWVKLERRSLRRDFRVVKDVVVNDKKGTTVVVDVWLEIRIADVERACFAVDDWDKALTNLVQHAVTSILGDREFFHILTDRSELSARLREDIATETARWGIVIEGAFLQKVSVLPEVAQQLFSTIAARLERQKADTEEEGHQRVALLDAETAAKTAQLVARAKGQYPAAVGRAFTELQRKPAVWKAYQELYALSQLRPHRTLAFQGFGQGEIRAVDAAMLDAQQPANGSHRPHLVTGGGNAD